MEWSKIEKSDNENVEKEDEE